MQRRGLARGGPSHGCDTLSPRITSVVETFAVSLGLFPLLSAGVIVLLYLALGHLGVAPRLRLLACLGIGLGSQFWHYARMGQEESLVAFGFALWLLGAAVLGQGRLADAGPLLRTGFDGLTQRAARTPVPAKVRLPESTKRLVQLYDAFGKPDDAAKWRRELEALTAGK